MTVPQRDRIDRIVRPRNSVPRYQGRARAGAAGSGSITQRLTAAGIAVFFFGFLATFGISVVTSAPTAERIIARALPDLTQVDRLLGIHLADLQEAAKGADQGNITLPGFPVTAYLASSEIRKDSAPTLQLLLDQRAAAAVYRRGAAAFTTSGEHSADETGPLFSGTWAMHTVLSLLNPREHARFQRYSLSLGLLTLATVVVLSLQVGGFGRMVGVGAASAAGAVLAALATFFVWLLVQFSYSGANSPVGSAAWGMIADAAWTILLIDIVALLACLGIALAGITFAAFEQSPRPDAQPAFSFDPSKRRHRPLD